MENLKFRLLYLPRCNPPVDTNTKTPM